MLVYSFLSKVVSVPESVVLHCDLENRISVMLDWLDLQFSFV